MHTLYQFTDWIGGECRVNPFLPDIEGVKLVELHVNGAHPAVLELGAALFASPATARQIAAALIAAADEAEGK